MLCDVMWIFTVSVDFPYKLLKKKKKTCLLKFGKKSSTLVNVVPDFRSIATREGGKWVNEFHPFPPWTKPTFLNADIRKVQNRGNARARVFKVRLICPAVVTKCEGPRSSRLQPAQLRAAPLRAIRARAREAKTFQPLLAPLVTMHSAALPALALQRPHGLQAAPTRRAHLSQRATQDRRRNAPWRGKARRLAKRRTLRREQGDRTSTRQGGAELSAGRRPSATS